MFYNINRFHFLALLTWQFAIFFAGQNIFGIFSNYVPKWRCGDSPPSKDCKVYLSCPREKLVFVDVAFKSAAMEFDWICGSKDYYQWLFSQVQFFGVLIGTVFFGTLSDTFGRKPIGILVLTLAIITTFLTGLAPTGTILFIIRFFVGLATGGILVVICTWIMEVLEPQQRMVLRGIFNWGWTRIFLSLICMLFPQWRISSYVCAACTIPALLLVIFVIPESPTWLHNKGFTQRRINSEKHMAKVAGIPYTKVEHKKIKSKSFCEIIKTKGLFKKLIVLWIMWFIASICGFANDLNSNKLSGDLYMNQILFGVLLVFSKMLLLFVDTNFANFKRRSLHQGAQFCTIMCFICLTTFILNDYHGYGFTVVYLLGTAFIEYTWDACYLCAIESMETPCRASATGTCSLMARVGAILAPLLNYAATWWPPALYITVVVLGSFSFLVSYFFLQETKNVDLDNVHIDGDVIEEVESNSMLPTMKSVQKVREDEI